MNAPQILVIDDDPNITSLLRRALIYDGYSVTTAADGPSGLTAARDRPPDLVILDVMLPHLDGLEVCRRLRAAGDMPILMLTARDDVSDRVQGLDSGADDYLVKPFAIEELSARVRALLRRREPGAGTLLRYSDLVIDVAAREVRRGERKIELTAKEFDLLLLFARHPRQVLSRDLILERVWGFDFEADTHVLEVYVGYLRNKLEAGGEPRLIHTIRGAGYVLRE
jgi:two-component system response regulator MprA